MSLTDPADSPTHHGLACFSMILLACGDRYLLLKRSASKRFAPGKWTGLGGRVESDELDDVHASALREFHEETGLNADQITDLSLRRVLLHNRPGAPLTLLLYFTGALSEPLVLNSDEGTLRWLSEDEIAQLDVIENTAEVLPLLIDDLTAEPNGAARPLVGAAHYRDDGVLERIVWA